MLLPEQKALVSQLALRALEAMRTHPDLDAGQRLTAAQEIANLYAEFLNVRLIVSEDLEAALLMPWNAGHTQLRRRVLERFKARKAADDGFDVSDERLVDLLGEVDEALLRPGLPKPFIE